jgi:hypothetical protein
MYLPDLNNTATAWILFASLFSLSLLATAESSLDVRIFSINGRYLCTSSLNPFHTSST